MSSYKYAPRDPEADNRRQMNARELPKKHFCRGCVWATVNPPVFICPFVEGSCAKIPETLENPDPERLHKWVRAVRRIAAAEDEIQRRAEGRMTAAGEEMQKRKKPNHGELYELDGIVHTIPEWAARAGMSDKTLRKRLQKGMSLQEAMATPVDKKYQSYGQKREPDAFILALRDTMGIE